MLLQSEVPYLKLGSILSHPDTNLVSLEGSFFRINRSVLASASGWLKGLFKECQSQDETTIYTNISEYHLSLLCQYVCTGMIAVAPDDCEEVMAAFSHMCLDMEDISLESKYASTCQVIEEQRKLILSHKKESDFMCPKPENKEISGSEEVKVEEQLDEDPMFRSRSEELMDTEFDGSDVGNECSPDKEFDASHIEDNIKKLPYSRNIIVNRVQKQGGEGLIAPSESEDKINSDFDAQTNLKDKVLNKKKVQVEKHLENQPRSESEEIVSADCDGTLVEGECLNENEHDSGSIKIKSKKHQSSEKLEVAKAKVPKPSSLRKIHMNYRPGVMKARKRQLTVQDEYRQNCEQPNTYFYFPQDGERNSARFQCTLCTRGFALKNQFFQHVKRHSAKGPEEAWACDQCPARFPSLPDMVKHKVINHTEKYGECQRCKMAIPVDTFLAHTKWKNCIDVQLQCVYCGLRLKSLKQREQHERDFRHDSKCALCETEFNTFTEHQYHVLTKHDGKFMVRCSLPSCLQLFENEVERNNHSRIVHSNRMTVTGCAQRKVLDGALADAQSFLAQNSHDSSLVCPKCNKKLRNKKSFDAHIANHENMEKEEIHNDENKQESVNDCDEEDTPLQRTGKVGRPKGSNSKGIYKSVTANPILQSLELVQPVKTLKCNQCPETFSTQCAGYGKANGSWAFSQHFLQHEESFDASKPYSCYFCPEKFIRAKLWTDHEMSVHFKRKRIGFGKIGKKSGLKSSTTCLFCHQEFHDIYLHEKDIYLHIKSEHKDKLPKSKTTLQETLYDCICCGKRFGFLYSYKLHLQKSGPYHDDKCPLCPEVRFKSWSEHKSHVSQCHNGNFAHRCELCPDVFLSDKMLKQHITDLHKTKNVCTRCGKSVVNIESHMKYAHEEQSEISCEKCGAVFHSKKGLHYHNLAEHNEKPLPICDFCGKEVTRNGMDRHILTYHTRQEDRPYKCSICPSSKGFINNQLLEEHMNTHSGEKPFKCKMCKSVAFASRGNLAAHIRSVHKGIKRAKKSAASK